MDYDSTAPEPAPVQPAQRDRTRLQAVSRERATAVGLMVAAAVSPQVGAALAVTLFDELGPAGAAFLRLAFAAIVLLAIWRPRLTGDLRLAAAFGLSLGLMNWSFYEAIARIPLGVAVTIEFAGPLLVAVIGSRRPLDLVWVALAAVGIVVLVDPAGGSVDPVGVGFALAAGACWMAYIYLNKRTGAAFPGGSGLAIAMAVGALIVLPAGVIQAEGALDEPELLGSALVVALALLGAAVLARPGGAAPAPGGGVRRADVARPGGRRAGRLRGARPGPRCARGARDRDGGRGQRRGGEPQSPMTSCRPDTRPRVPGCLAR